MEVGVQNMYVGTEKEGPHSRQITQTRKLNQHKMFRKNIIHAV